MASLLRVALAPVPMYSCRAMQKAIRFAASSGAPSGSLESFPLNVKEPSSDADIMAQKRVKKRLQIAGVDQEELVDPWLLADQDSRFAEFYGVQIHYKIAHPTGTEQETNKQADDVGTPSFSASSSSTLTIDLPAILLHGFGASLFSWERVLKPLAQLLRSRVVAFDRPAFGLTSRIKVPLTQSKSGSGNLVPVPVNPYSLGFSSTATIAFIDFLQSNKAILIGHSAGCVVAADAYLKAPERVAALILIAPALVAPLLPHKKPQASPESNKNWLLRGLIEVWRKVVWVFSLIGAVFRSLGCGILGAILRSAFGVWLIRMVMDRLSLRAVRMAWYDKGKVDDYVIAGYTKPLKCRDWERALLEYVIALVGDPSMHSSQVPLSDRLDEIVCPVLIITGDSDALVPAWNAERLSRALQNAKFHVMKNCGHLPHEEKPDEFLSIIQQFMCWVQQRATPPAESVVFMPA